jgi:uncharacterized membrane protein YeiH
LLPHDFFIDMLDWVAVAVFAATGALAARRKHMDIVGFAVLASVAGVGGGTVRDVMLGAFPVAWVKEPSHLVVCLGVSLVVFFAGHVLNSRSRWLEWLDAAGLALVAVIGAERALAAGTGDVVAVVMGVITAAFGGVIRDVLAGDVPHVLRREIYVTAALLGAATFILCTRLGAERVTALTAGIACGFAIRAFAIYSGWSLPAYNGGKDLAGPAIGDAEASPASQAHRTLR